MLFDYHRNTNYSVVDIDLIEELYRREYQEQVLGRRRLRMMNASQVVGPRRAATTGSRSTVEYLPTGERRERLDADAVVYATGYRPGRRRCACWARPPSLVERRRRRRCPRSTATTGCGLTSAGRRRRSTCRAAPSTPTASRSTLLSNIAVRAGEIVESVMARGAPARPAVAPVAPVARAG